MFTYSKDGITIASILDTRRRNNSGMFPVKIRVTYRRERKYYSTGKELLVEDWERLPATRNLALREMRESIENSFSLVRSNVEALAESGGFSFDALNMRLGKATGTSVNTTLRAKIELLNKEERIGTSLYYNDVLKSVIAFAGNSITFDMVSIDWLKRYEKFLLDKGCKRSTIGMYMRGIRTIMNEARKAGVIKETQYPFGKDKYEIQLGEGRKKALTTQQISQIVHYFDGNQTTERYRDLWFFMYLCNGINVADLVKLKYCNIQDGEICFVRQKTERTAKNVKEIRALITPEMEAIIKKWGNKPSADNFIFPYLVGIEDAHKRKIVTKDLTRRINKRMKVIGKALGIGDVTTYVARHSYATVLKRGGVNVAYISESLGHSSLNTTESYLASFEKEERQKNASLLTKFNE